MENISLELALKLRNFNNKLNRAEKANFKLLLGLSAGGLISDFSRPNSSHKAKAIDTVTETLSKLQPYSGRISKNGVAYIGRPDFMTNELLSSLQDEARSVRPFATKFDEHFLGRGAPIANELSTSKMLLNFVLSHTGEVKSTGVASFLFYDEEGQGIDPHIDTDIFSLNVILMLSHEDQNNPNHNSALFVFPPGEKPERIDLNPGDMVIMFAGSIAHGRQRMKKSESVSILTFGFHPLGE
ncbi:MAG: hypothetical protein JWR12_3091 [Mucilaginibacter sp.]|nr:hypothetical protein [Mucilaginibacter sp.]